MDEMDEFYQKIQTFLIKADSEVGKLKFLSSRTTEESSERIEHITNSISSIFTACNIRVKEEVSASNVKCIEALKYLILNTNFKAQDFLQDDLQHGHLVDICPALSPYLFIDLIWCLGYEELLAESILYFPLDLCIEILEIVRRCVVTLTFPRGFTFLVTITNNCYMKLVITRELGIQSMDFEANLTSLIINYQEILNLLIDNKITNLSDVTDIERSKRYGYILQEMLKLTRHCLGLHVKGAEINSENEKLYKLTFGREPFKKCDLATITGHLKCLDLELTNALLKKVKEINCNIYLDWASLESATGSSASLQQMIGIECFSLIQFIRENHIEGQDHLVTCLQHLSVNPQTVNSCATMDLEALREGVEKGNHDCLKELLIQHKNWDDSVMNSIEKRIDLFDKNDAIALLEYLSELMQKEGHEDYKQRVYNIVTRIFLHQNLKDLYEITLEYISKHNAENILESAHTEEMFEAFVLMNPNFRTPVKMKTLLFFLLKNPVKFLTILIKICIGSSKYSHMMINAEDLNFISPIMNIRDERGKLILSCLLKIGLEKEEFTPMKFGNFLEAMLRYSIFTSDELMSCVFIPMMEAVDLPLSTLRSTLISTRHMVSTLNKLNVELLLNVLAKKMSQIRRNRSISKHLNSELLTLIIKIVQTVLRTRDNWFQDAGCKRWISELEASLHPIDKFYFSKIFTSSEYLPVTEIIEDYMRQINTTLQKILPPSQEIAVHKLGDLENEILKNLILACTESEYLRIASEIAIIHWDRFKYSTQMEAFDNIVRITIDACYYSLRAPNIKSDHFSFLIKSLIKFVKSSISSKLSIDEQFFLDTLLTYFRKLNESVKDTAYENPYNEMTVRLNNRPSNEPTVDSLTEIMEIFGDFGDKCRDTVFVEKCEATGENLRTVIYQDFISMCLVVSLDNQFCVMEKVKDLFLSIQ